MFILKDFFDKRELNQGDLESGIKEYKSYLKKFPPPQVHASNYYDYILGLKRNKIQFGPYQNLTLFEISNRLFSDLVVLDGAKKIFEDPTSIGCVKIKSMNLALSNIGGFDLLIETDKGLVHGEAFNAAPSFFKLKTDATVKKLIKEKVNRAVIIFNEDALDTEGKNLSYLENKLKNTDKEIHYIICDLVDWKNLE